MGVIRKFHELNEEQRQSLYHFLKIHRPDEEQSFEAYASYYGGELFEHGAHVLIDIEGDGIRGCIGVITREIPVKDEAYLVRFHVEGENRSTAAKLLSQAVGLCGKARRILAGIAPTDAFIGEVVRGEGFEERHRALVLSLDVAVEDKPLSGRGGGLQYRNVDESNRRAFQSLHNDVFRFVSNGGAVSDEEMDEMAGKHAADPELLGLAYSGESLVGFYELELTDGGGWIHCIGIDPSCRGKGYGRELLLHLVAVLARRGAERIKLIVMSNNEPAMMLYRGIGFREERVLSIWYGREV